MSKRTFLFTSGFTPTHVIRPCLIARHIQQQGEDVVFCASARTNTSLFEQYGFPYYRYSERSFERHIIINDIPLEDIQGQVEELVALYTSIGPDVVIGDFMPSAAVAARILGVPFVSIVEFHRTPQFFREYDVAVPRESNLSKLPERIARRLFNREYISRFWRAGLTIPAYNTILSQHGLPEVQDLLDLDVGDLNLISDLPQSAPMADLPDTYHFVGPIFEFPQRPAPGWLADAGRRRPVIFVWSETAEVQRAAVEAFGQEEATLIILASPSLEDPARLRAAAPRSFIAETLPFDAVLDIADVVIGYGSMSTTYCTLRHGVPIVCCPYVAPHLWFAERLEALGVAIRVDYNPTPEALRAAVYRIVDDPNYRSRARQLGQDIAPERSSRRAAELIIRSQESGVRSQESGVRSNE